MWNTSALTPIVACVQIVGMMKGDINLFRNEEIETTVFSFVIPTSVFGSPAELTKPATLLKTVPRARRLHPIDQVIVQVRI